MRYMQLLELANFIIPAPQFHAAVQVEIADDFFHAFYLGGKPDVEALLLDSDYLLSRNKLNPFYGLDDIQDALRESGYVFEEKLVRRNALGTTYFMEKWTMPKDWNNPCGGSTPGGGYAIVFDLAWVKRFVPWIILLILILLGLLVFKKPKEQGVHI